jgi:hypothetical protein
MLYYHLVALTRKYVTRKKSCCLSLITIPSTKITLTPPTLEGFLFGATLAAYSSIVYCPQNRFIFNAIAPCTVDWRSAFESWYLLLECFLVSRTPTEKQATRSEDIVSC